MRKVQNTELYLLEEALSYQEDDKAKLESEVQWEEFIRIMKDFERRATKDPNNPPSIDPRTPIAPAPVNPALIDLPSVYL